jgi:hypothetical protein
MARYLLRVNVTAANINQVRKMLEANGLTAQAQKLEKMPSRADRFAECEAMVSDAASEVESLKDELQEWRDNLPENMQSGDKADQLDDAISNLDDIHSTLDGVSFDSVEFPSMMG